MPVATTDHQPMTGRLDGATHLFDIQFAGVGDGEGAGRKIDTALANPR